MIVGQEFCIRDMGKEFLVQIIDINKYDVLYQYIHGPNQVVINHTFKRYIESFKGKITKTSPEEYKLKHL